LDSLFLKISSLPYGKNQCAKGCHKILYDNEKLIKEMVLTQKDCMIPTALVPKCPVCEGNMAANLRGDEYFVEDEEWEQSNLNYRQFLNKIKGTNFVMIEIGVGYNTPGIIKYPFEQIIFVESHATLIRINRDYPECLEENALKTICFWEDTETILKEFNKP
jgi:NAD-dependent SIR2 family protein deacetylase